MGSDRLLFNAIVLQGPEFEGFLLRTALPQTGFSAAGSSGCGEAADRRRQTSGGGLPSISPRCPWGARFFSAASDSYALVVCPGELPIVLVLFLTTGNK